MDYRFKIQQRKTKHTYGIDSNIAFRGDSSKTVKMWKDVARQARDRCQDIEHTAMGDT